MLDTGIQEWLVLATIGAAGIFSMLHVMASAIENEKRIRDHREECRRIKAAYIESTSRVRAACDHANSDVEIVAA